MKYIYIYIYIERERETAREKERVGWKEGLLATTGQGQQNKEKTRNI